MSASTDPVFSPPPPDDYRHKTPTCSAATDRLLTGDDGAVICSRPHRCYLYIDHHGRHRAKACGHYFDVAPPVLVSSAGRVDPDCRDGKHAACPGWTFDAETDRPGDCECPCHEEQR